MVRRFVAGTSASAEARPGGSGGPPADGDELVAPLGPPRPRRRRRRRAGRRGRARRRPREGGYHLVWNRRGRHRPRRRAGRRPDRWVRRVGPRRNRPVEGVHGVAAGRLGCWRVRTSRCPRSRGGSSPSPTPSASSSSSTDRSSRAGTSSGSSVSATCAPPPSRRPSGPKLVGNEKMLHRGRLLQQLKKHRGRATFRHEQERRERVFTELRQARVTENSGSRCSPRA